MFWRTTLAAIVTLVTSIIMYVPAASQSATAEYYNRVRAQREAEDARRRELQRSQEQERVRKLNAEGFKRPADNTDKPVGASKSGNTNKNYFLDNKPDENGLFLKMVWDKWGLVDKQGKEVLKTVYQKILPFSGGYYGVYYKESPYDNRKAGFVDKEGKVVIDYKFDYIVTGFENGWAKVVTGNTMFSINEEGRPTTTGEPWTAAMRAAADDAHAKADKKAAAERATQNFGSAFKNKQAEPARPAAFTGPFLNGLARIGYTGGKYGYMNQAKKVVIPMIYDDAPLAFSEGLAFVKQGSKWGCIDNTGKVIVPFHYDDAYEFEHGLARVSISAKSGVIDRSGKIVAPFEYDLIGRFKDGFASVSIKGKWGLIDKKGKLVIPVVSQHTIEFSGGLAAVYYNGKYALFNKDMKQVTPFIEDGYSTSSSKLGYQAKVDGKWVDVDPMSPPVANPTPLIYKYLTGEETVGPFYNERALVKLKYLYGYIDRNELPVVPFLYHDANNFSDGMAAVMMDKMWGFIDTSGKLVIPLKYRSVRPFSEGLAMVTEAYTWGIINRSGAVVVQLVYDDLGNHFSEGLLPVKRNSKMGFITRNGEEVIPVIYQEVKSFSGGLAPVKENDKWGYINNSGKVVMPFRYQYIGYLRNGIATIKLNDQWGFIDSLGGEITPAIYESVYDFVNGIGRVQQNGKWGFVDVTGKLLSPIKYTTVDRELSEGLRPVKTGDKWGYLNAMCQEVIPAIYDKAEEFKNGQAKVVIDYKSFTIDTKGKRIAEY